MYEDDFRCHTSSNESFYNLNTNNLCSYEQVVILPQMKASTTWISRLILTKQCSCHTSSNESFYNTLAILRINVIYQVVILPQMKASTTQTVVINGITSQVVILPQMKASTT